MKKMGYIFIFLTILIVIGGTSYKVIKTNHHNLIMVSEKRIIEAAKRCLNDDVCKENKITLATLYANNYLEEEINPLTKEIYNKESYILKEENNYQFIVVD